VQEQRVTRAIRPTVSGVAVVCCVHDREKRQVRTEAHVAALGLSVGQVYDPRQHKIHECSCCQNLFVDPSDEPRLCTVCLGPLKHALGGPLPEPKGVVG
jgi:hypothetical protein